MGTVTDATGRYRLARVPSGAHTVVASMLGYAAARRDTLFRAGTATLDFRLQPAVLEVPEIVISARAQRSWRRRLRQFERLFLGETENARQTCLLNPEVLDFDARWWGRLVARASAPLVVENRALGYRITYHLRAFTSEGGSLRYDGEPLFEPLVPESPQEAARWEAARRAAYLGSFRHFMLALLSDSCRARGFAVYLIPQREEMFRSDRRFNVAPHHLLREGPTPAEKELRFHGAVEVLYLGEAADDAFVRWMAGRATDRGDPQRSWITLTDGPTLVDHTGEVVDPYGVTVYGYFAFERLADLVPKEYRPAEGP